jgi:hypothetical protein
MGRHFLARVVVYWFVHLLPGYPRIVLAWVGNRLILYFEGSGLFLYPLGLVGCSSCEVRLRSCTVGFLPG